jgi:hypothetical protein
MSRRMWKDKSFDLNAKKDKLRVNHIKVNVKESLYSPEQALSFSGD